MMLVQFCNIVIYLQISMLHISYFLCIHVCCICYQKWVKIISITSIHISYLMHSLHAHTLSTPTPPHKSTSLIYTFKLLAHIYLQITSPCFYAYCRLTMLTTRPRLSFEYAYFMGTRKTERLPFIRQQRTL